MIGLASFLGVSLLLVSPGPSAADPMMGMDFLACNSTNPNNICARVTCAPLNKCQGIVQEYGSRCGCCPFCVTILKKGADCPPKVTHGGIPTTMCPTDNPCEEKKNKCDATAHDSDGGGLKPLKDILKSCLRLRAILSEIQNDPVSIESIKPFSFRKDMWTPECDELGLFKPVQCQDTRCFCVEPINGRRIFGQQHKHISENMTCACSTALEERKERLRMGNKSAEWRTYPQEHCTLSGDYEKLQCYKDICYCADQKTGRPQGAMVKVQQLKSLPCYDKKKYKDDYLTRCEKQLIKERKIIYDFSQKGVNVQGTIEIDCDIDGSFGNFHCTTDTCYCTDREGISFGTYKMSISNGVPEMDMSCRCARDEEDNQRNFANYEGLKCEQWGNFLEQQCMDSACFCTDEYGNRVTDFQPNSLGETVRLKCVQIRSMIPLWLSSQQGPNENDNENDNNDATEGTTKKDDSYEYIYEWD